jgi:hypothetical protein
MERERPNYDQPTDVGRPHLLAAVDQLNEPVQVTVRCLEDLNRSLIRFISDNVHSPCQRRNY